MKIIQGDLIKLAIDGHFDVIVHGCNCQNQMGKGIAKTIRQKFPSAYEADLETEKGSREKLGTFSTTTVECGDHNLTIVNGYTQFHWRGKGTKADYDAIRSVFKGIKLSYSGQRIGYPLIGAGLASGDWDTIEKIIDEELIDEDHTLVKFQPSK